MSRGLPALVSAAVEASDVALLLFAELDFPSGVVRVHNGLGTYSWGGNDWLGVGTLGEISKVEEGQNTSPYSITLSLSGLDASMVDPALDEKYFMRDVSIYLGVLDSTDSLLATPTSIWNGFMDNMKLSLGANGGDVIQLTAESELARFDKSANYMFTNAQQQKQSSGDLFFNHLHKIQDVKINWGGKGAGGGVSGGRIDNIITPSIPGRLLF
jgi:hypothetical protein